MQIRYPNIFRSGKKRWSSSLLASACLYSHNFISALWIFHSLALPTMHEYIVCLRFMYTELSLSPTHSGLAVFGSAAFYYDIFSYEALSTGCFFIARSSFLLFWYKHFWCLIILIKMLFLGEREEKERERRTWETQFLLSFWIWGFLLWDALLCKQRNNKISRAKTFYQRNNSSLNNIG